MKATTLGLMVLAIALIASPMMAASLAVTAGAALEGNFGMDVMYDGDTTSAYVVSAHPDNETAITVTYLFDVPAGFDFDSARNLGGGQTSHHMNLLIMDTDIAPGFERQHVSVHLLKDDIGGGNFQFKVWSRLYAPTNPLAAGDGFMYRTSTGDPMEVNLPISAGAYPVTVTFKWAAESGPGNADGVWVLQQTNSVGTTQGKTDTGMSGNDGKNVDQILMGGVGGSDAETTGSLYFDSYESMRGVN